MGPPQRGHERGRLRRGVQERRALPRDLDRDRL